MFDLRYGLPTLFVVALGCAGTNAAPVPPPSPPAPSPPAVSEAPPAAEQQFAPEPIAYVFEDPDRRKRIEEALPLIDPIIESALAEQGLVGVSFGLIVDGDLVYAKGYGKKSLDDPAAPDADTVYRIGSVTKSFTALAILSLRDAGKLALDDALADHLKEANSIVYPTRDSRPVTLRQLLTHTSGFPRLGSFVYWEPESQPSQGDVLSSLVDLELNRAPSGGFEYSNLGFSVLGMVAQEVSGVPYRDYVTDKILTPLGMTSTVWDPEQVAKGRLAPAYKKQGETLVEQPHWRMGASEGAGGLYSSVADMARYVSFELAAYPPRNDADDAPLARSSVRETHASAMPSGRLSVVRHDDPKRPPIGANARAYGFGWGVYQTCELDFFVGHNGGTEGYVSNVSMLPEYGIGVVVLANLSGAELGLVTGKVMRELVERAELTKRVPDPAVRAARFEPAMSRLLSVYQTWDEATYTSMLAKGRPEYPGERQELADYKALHGSCDSYKLVELLNAASARYAFTCERGEFEMVVGISEDDQLIRGFTGISRGVPTPPDAQRAANDVLALMRGWNAATHRRRWATPEKDPKAEASFARVRAGHQGCRIDSYVRRFERDEFGLSCERGGELVLSFALDKDSPDKIASYSIDARAQEGACPAE